MSLGPILPGRIPASLIATRLRQNLNTNARDLARLQEQVATNQKFILPSDAPAAAARTLVLQKTLERQDQLVTNVQTSRSFLQASDQALTEVGTALNQAKSMALAGIGDTATDAERQTLADEVATMLKQIVSAANSQYNGRYLFGGSVTGTAPFVQTAGGVLYRGDSQALQSYMTNDLLLANNVDGQTAFAASTVPITRDVNPAVTLQTRLADLRSGEGVTGAPITVTLTDGTTTQTQTVDLTGSQTVQDVKSRLEAAFAGGPLTLSVDVDPASNSGLRLTPSAGTVAVADGIGTTTAADLGIKSAAAATIMGDDLNPRLTAKTPLSALNGGTGIGATAGTGLRITNGDTTRTIDLSTAVTVEDVFNLVQAADPNLNVGINEAGNGLAITSRLSGVPFAIGENGGQNAALLGIRTFTADTRLADLNGGLGVPVDDGVPLQITRRDGNTVDIDLSGAVSVQDVLDRINAVAPGQLVASLGTVGNGISIVDNDGVSTGPLIVVDNTVARGLGIAGTEAGSDPAVPINGSEINPQSAPGVFSLLSDLERALRDGDNIQLQRLAGLFDPELERFTQVRGEVGSRLKLMDDLENRLLDQQVNVKETLSLEFEPDLTEIVTRLTQVQSSYEATLQIAARTSQLSLLNYL